VPLWRGLDEVPPDWGGSVAAVGVFDGVHRGHQAVVRRAVEAGRRRGLPLVVVTFDPHPMTVVRPDQAPDLLGTVEQRVRLLQAAGADAVLVLPFTADLSKLTPEEFVRRVLVDGLHVAEVVVGADFRFGHRAAGDVTVLRALGERYGFAVGILEEQADATARFSSTRIRELLLAGDAAGAAAALGRPYAIEGLVVEGDRRGRDLGFPTANLACPPGIVIPADGVYAGWLAAQPPARLPAAISVGDNPTFEGAAHRVEAYVLDRDDLELYGRQVTVEFVARLRGMQRFASVEELRAGMADDVQRSRRLLHDHVPDHGGSSGYGTHDLP
jgi:riboflavin kinase/FMN adenylyltransferase